MIKNIFMSKRREHPTLAELHELFFYDPDTGFLHWKIRPARSKIMWGDRVGEIPIHSRYQRVKINGVRYYQHNLVWIMNNGDLPEELTVDHKDKDRTNNRLDNLRLANTRQQQINQNVRGFSRMTHRILHPWIARHKVGSRYLLIGSFTTALQARLAYERSTSELEPDFASTWFTDVILELCSGGPKVAWVPGYGGK